MAKSFAKKKKVVILDLLPVSIIIHQSRYKNILSLIVGVLQKKIDINSLRKILILFEIHLIIWISLAFIWYSREHFLLKFDGGSTHRAGNSNPI